MTTVASILNLLVIYGTAGAQGSDLPIDCIHSTPTVSVSCGFRQLTAVPDGIPQDVVRMYLGHNEIRNIAHLPLLKLVTSLDLSNNLIDSVPWVSVLRNLPALNFFYLSRNRIKFFDFGVLVSGGTELAFIDLSQNQLVSITEPKVGSQSHFNGRLVVHSNPFNCDCKTRWLVNKLACLQACGAGQDPNKQLVCCRSCMVCFLLVTIARINELTCDSPTQLQTLPMWQVSRQLLECQASEVAHSSRAPRVLRTEHVGEVLLGTVRPGNVQGNNSLSSPTASSPKTGHSSPSTAWSRSITLQTSLEYTTDTVVKQPTDQYIVGQGDVAFKGDPRGHQKETSKTTISTYTSTTGSQSASSGSLVIATIAVGSLLGVVFISSMVYLARRVIIYQQARKNKNGTRRVYILPPGYPALDSNVNAISGQMQQSFVDTNCLSANFPGTGTGVTGPAVLEMVPPRLPRTPPVENKLSQKKNVGILSFHPFHLSRGATNSAAKVKEAGAFPGPNVASSSKGAEHTDYAYEHYPPDITKDPGSDHEYEYLP